MFRYCCKATARLQRSVEHGQSLLHVICFKATARTQRSVECGSSLLHVIIFDVSILLLCDRPYTKIRRVRTVPLALDHLCCLDINSKRPPVVYLMGALTMSSLRTSKSPTKYNVVTHFHSIPEWRKQREKGQSESRVAISMN